MNLLKRISIFILLYIGLIQCHTLHDLSPREGYINVPGGKVWYKIVGKGSKPPILMLHGGPGATSYYLRPLESLAADRSLIFFDQLGCGRSTRQMDTTQMNIAFYVDEVERVKHALGLKKFYLYGQSWGTILAVEYYFAHPEGIQGIILASPALSGKLWIRDARLLLSQLPDSLQRIIYHYERLKKFDAPAYQQAMMVYYKKHVARKQPWSADIDSTFAYLGHEVYTYMNGPSEFTFTGTMQYYDATKKLPRIKVPVLFICGQYDEARPETTAYYAGLVPNARLAIIPDAAHMTMQDNPEKDLQAIREFLYEVEEKK